MIGYEQISPDTLPSNQRGLLVTQNDLNYGQMQNMLGPVKDDKQAVNITEMKLEENQKNKEEFHGGEAKDQKEETGELPLKRAKVTTSFASIKDDTNVPSTSSPGGSIEKPGGAFPVGLYDIDGQQLDLRQTNSWRAVLDNVPVSEMLEVLMVNTVAPFILNKELKSLMMKSSHKYKFIVNVSAMEGQFNRKSKTKFHPHTNMAKSALNMMTRTAALGYKEDGIYMTAVDTGWVSDERPFHIAQYEKHNKGFILPLDCVDGAARILDPVVSGITNDIVPHHAVFLKNYHPYPW